MADANRTQMLDPNRTQLGAAPALDPNKTVMGQAPSINATQTIKPVQCPVCKTFNPAGVMFCVDCGLIFDRALQGDAFGAPAVQVPQLVDATGREHPIRPGQNVIGREGDIMLIDGRISRRHAQIDSQRDTLTLQDLGSTNGTTVDGVKLEQGETKTLTGTEKLSFGGLEARISLPGGAGGNTTQILGGNRTAAISAAPTIDDSAAKLTGAGADLPLKKGPNTFGRKAENDVQISDPYVSGKHGVIEITDAGIFLTDIGSSNGTLLNDAKLAPNMRTAIGEEDVIRLGSLELRVVLKKN